MCMEEHTKTFFVTQLLLRTRNPLDLRNRVQKIDLKRGYSNDECEARLPRINGNVVKNRKYLRRDYLV